MTLKADIPTSTLKSALTLLSTVTDKAKLTIAADGISAKAVDPAHVAVVSVEVPSNAFDFYEADPCEIGLDLKKVQSVLKLAGPGDTVSLSAGKDMRMTIRIGSITRRTALLDTAGIDSIKIPALAPTAHISLPSKELMRGIRAVDGITDHLKLTATPEAFIMSCERDTDSMELRLSSEDVSIDTDAEVRSIFPLDYMAIIAKAIPSGAIIAIGLDTDYPLTLETTSATDLKALFMVAPEGREQPR